MKNKILLGSAGFILALLFMAGICLPALAQDAQTAPPPGVDLDKIKSQIQNNPNLSDDQKKELLSRFENPEDQSGNQGSLGTTDCFSFYRFGSVSVLLDTKIPSVSVGEKASFTATIRNENNYPIVEGNLWSQILRENPTGEAQNGNHLIDQFLASDKIFLAPHESKRISFSYSIPGGLPEGKYFLAAFYTSSNSYEISGLTPVNNVYAGLISFDVKGAEKKAIYPDRNNVRVNDKQTAGRSPTTEVKEGSDAKINFPLVNEKVASEKVKLSYTLYLWDTLRSENIITKSSETVSVDANGTKDLQYVIPRIQSGTYQLRITAEYPDAKSMLEIRLTTDNVKKGRVNFAALDKFPLAKGDQGKILACFHNAGGGIGSDGEVILTLRDEKGNIVAQKNRQGFISGNVQGLEQEFQADSAYDYLVLTTAVKNKEGKIVNETSTVYDKRAENAVAATSDMSEWKKISIGVLIVLILLVIASIAYILFKKMKKNIVVLVLTLVAASTLFFLSASVSQAACSSSYGFGLGTGWGFWGWYLKNGLYFNGTINMDPNCLFKKSDGTCVKNNDTLNIGDIISFSDPSGEWFASGGTFGTPPFSKAWSAIGSSGIGCCGTSSWCTDYGDGNVYCMDYCSSPESVYGRAFVKNRTPNIQANNASLVGINGETVTAIQGGTVTLTTSPIFNIRNQSLDPNLGYCSASNVPSRMCINTDVGFGFWSFFGRSSPSCYNLEEPPGSPYRFNEGTLVSIDQSVNPCPMSVTLNILAPSTPPTAILACDTPLTTGVPGNCTLTGTDDKNTRLRYLIDYNNDKIADESWDGPVGSHVFSHSWPTAGAYPVNAQTQELNADNSLGQASPWISATIQANAVPIPGQCKTPPNNQTYCPPNTPPTAANELCDRYDLSRPPTRSGSGPWSWTCYGSGGESDMPCNAYLGTRADGKCGTANGITICENNTSPQWCAPGSNLVGSAPPTNAYDVSWQCAGTCNGQTVDCSARGSKACGWIETSP